MKKIYLDHAAGTPVDPEVLRTMEPYFSERFGNPGSVHAFGQEAIAALDRSRETIAKALGVGFRQVVFTSSATEANNLALRGAVKKFLREHKASARVRPRIIISAIEHESVLETARDLERDGAELILVSVGRDGIVDLKKIKGVLTSETAIVSVMYANNEIGTIQPIAEIADIIRNGGSSIRPLFHTDAAQAFQFLDCEPKNLGVDLMTISSHKIYGPKGAGALYVKDLKDLEPIVTGGGQEFGLRSGTENVPAIVGFAKAVELAVAVRQKESERIKTLRDEFWHGLKNIFPNAEMNPATTKTSGIPALPNILNVYFPGHAAQDLLTKFDLNGLAASSGSACRSRALESSYIIEALGYSKERVKSSIRFSFGRTTTEADIKESLKIAKNCL